MVAPLNACFVCGAKRVDQGRYCPYCGTLLDVACNHCGQQNLRSQTHCMNCRGQLRDEGASVDLAPALETERSLERRQLTIMFTDLVNSTGLADSMDPEDFRALIEAHRTIAVAPINHYGGVVARYMGDGMLVLFGYPEAHEDDPERAVRAGLEVTKATVEMNERWVGEGKGRIAVRIGVHTGIVVVGDVLKADVQEMMAVFGKVPSIAARLQNLAKPNGLIISRDTKTLLPTAINCRNRGKAELKGIKDPIEIFEALDVRSSEEDRRATGRVLPFVNRDQELATIRRHWQVARQGEGSSILIEGDPGIGKSRLIRAVKERIVTQPSRWLTTRTSPYAANADFFAFSELFRRILSIDGQRASRARPSFARLRRTLEDQGISDPEIAIGLAGLLSINIPKKITPTPLQPERIRELTLNAITAWLLHDASKQPLILVIEDLHWADASSQEAIDRLKSTLKTHPLLLILTTRSAAGTSLTGDSAGLSGTSAGVAVLPGTMSVVEAERAKTPSSTSEVGTSTPAQASSADAASIRLERLRPGAARDLLGHALRGADLPQTAVTILLQRANGVPLFLEELPKPVLEAGGTADHAPIELPATLRDSLMAQLDRMGEAKAVAQTASVIGHSFDRPLLEHVWEGDRQTLETGLATLSDAAVITREHEATTAPYGFRHALLAEIAYDSLLRDDRRRIHQKTADILFHHFRPLAETRPDLLARHHEAAGDHEEAFDCWMKAGKAAAGRSANVEAMEHFKDAEAALENGGMRKAEKRLSLQLARGPVLISQLGWADPEVERTYRQALRLSRRMDLGHREKFRIWGGLFNVYLLSGDLKNARKTMERGHKIAGDAHDPELLLFSHRSLGLCSVFAARYDEALTHMTVVEALISESPPQERRQTEIYGTNPCVVAFSIKAWCHWFKGYAQEARHWSSKAIRTAEAAKHPFSLCYALCLGASLAQFQNRVGDALQLAERALGLSTKHAFPYWSGWSKIVKGWSMAIQGRSEIGLLVLKEGLEEYEATRAAQMSGYGLCLLALAYKQAGDWQNAISSAEAAAAEIERTGIIFYQEKALEVLEEVRANRPL